MGEFDSYSSHGGWFGGLAIHSMILGPISMISSIYFYVLYLGTKNKIYLILFFITAMSTVFASSRAAILGLVMVIAYGIIFGRFDAYLRKRMFGILIVCGLMTIPIADVAFRGVINKQEGRIAETGGSLNSRQDKFDYRISEFEKSPILGVGFCAIDINGGDRYVIQNGQVEPGSSHLAVLSMTGILGMIAYIMILYQAFKNSKEADTLHSKFMLMCLLAIFVHAWFEGYVFSAGGFLSLLYWLIIGQCIDCKNSKQISNS